MKTVLQLSRLSRSFLETVLFLHGDVKTISFNMTDKQTRYFDSVAVAFFFPSFRFITELISLHFFFSVSVFLVSHTGRQMENNRNTIIASQRVLIRLGSAMVSEECGSLCFVNMFDIFKNVQIQSVTLYSSVWLNILFPIKVSGAPNG